MPAAQCRIGVTPGLDIQSRQSRLINVTWQVQEAKQRFSELVERAVSEGPQIVTKHGRPTVAVVEIEEFRRLVRKPLDFKEFLLSIPKGDPLEIERSQDLAREIEL
jgi:prevent-host-death family protein